MSLLLVLLLVALAALIFGGWGHSSFGYLGWSPLGVILAVILVLWLLGDLHG